MHRFTCRLDEDLFNLLQTVSDHTGKPMAEAAREVLRETLPKLLSIPVETHIKTFQVPSHVHQDVLNESSKILGIKMLREHLGLSLKHAKILHEYMTGSIVFYVPGADHYHDHYKHLNSQVVLEAFKLSRSEGWISGLAHLRKTLGIDLKTAAAVKASLEHDVNLEATSHI